jgi:hypothetical protein
VRLRLGEVERSGLAEGTPDRIAVAKSSRVVCEVQSIIAWDRPKTLVAI